MRLLPINGAFTAAGSKAEFLTLDPHRNLENSITIANPPTGVKAIATMQIYALQPCTSEHPTAVF